MALRVRRDHQVSARAFRQDLTWTAIPQGADETPVQQDGPQNWLVAVDSSRATVHHSKMAKMNCQSGRAGSDKPDSRGLVAGFVYL